MKKWCQKVVTLMVSASLCLLLMGCASGGTSQAGSQGAQEANQADESYFAWDGNMIWKLTEEGAKQTSLVIPARCEGFSGSIFMGTSVESVSFEDDDDVDLSNAFMGSEKLKSVTLPKNLTKIPEGCFKANSALEEIVIPAAVQQIGESAFLTCISLKKVVFEGAAFRAIPQGCFEGCSALETITIPDGVKSIGYSAFRVCGLKEVHFSENVVFEDCDPAAFSGTAEHCTAYVVKGSWCDEHQEVWNFGFQEVKEE